MYARTSFRAERDGKTTRGKRRWANAIGNVPLDRMDTPVGELKNDLAAGIIVYDCALSIARRPDCADAEDEGRPSGECAGALHRWMTACP